jgi:hypothetical protein
MLHVSEMTCIILTKDWIFKKQSKNKKSQGKKTRIKYGWWVKRRDFMADLDVLEIHYWKSTHLDNNSVL